MSLFGIVTRKTSHPSLAVATMLAKRGQKELEANTTNEPPLLRLLPEDQARLQPPGSTIEEGVVTEIHTWLISNGIQVCYLEANLTKNGADESSFTPKFFADHSKVVFVLWYNSTPKTVLSQISGPNIINVNGELKVPMYKDIIQRRTEIIGTADQPTSGPSARAASPPPQV